MKLIILLWVFVLSDPLSAKQIERKAHTYKYIIEITLIGDFSYPAKGHFGQVI